MMSPKNQAETVDILYASSGSGKRSRIHNTTSKVLVTSSNLNTMATISAAYDVTSAEARGGLRVRQPSHDSLPKIQTSHEAKRKSPVMGISKTHHKPPTHRRKLDSYIKLEPCQTFEDDLECLSGEDDRILLRPGEQQKMQVITKVRRVTSGSKTRRI